MSAGPFRAKQSAATLVAALRSDPHAPMSAMIEIADRCNEVCVHCYQIQGQKGEMSTEELKRVLDELAEMGVLFLTISGGEPTLRKDFLEIVAHAREKRFAVKIFTNGLTMTQALARRLSELAVQEVQISLYSHRADVHDGVTRVPGSFEKTVAAVRNLVAEGVSVVLKSPLMEANADGFREYGEFVTGLGADHMMDPQLDPREDGDVGPTALAVDDATYLEARRVLGKAREARDDAADAPLDRDLCGACSGNVHVEPNGEMRPCTQLTVPVGHALREGVREAWEGNEAALVLRNLKWADVHGCRECDLRAWCSRCFAVAKVEAGDMLGPYPSACHRARLEYELGQGQAPRIVAGDGPSEVGPYRRVEAGTFQPFAGTRTAEDEALAERHRWIRAAQDGPGREDRTAGLVQLRTTSRGRDPKSSDIHTRGPLPSPTATLDAPRTEE